MINLQIIKNILIVLVAVVILFILIIPQNNGIKQETFNGEIYNQTTTAQEIKQPNLQEPQTKEFVSDKQITDKPQLEKISLYTQEKSLPQEFIAVKTDDKNQSDFIIISKTQNIQDKKAPTPITKQPKQEQKSKPKAEEPKKQEEIPPTPITVAEEDTEPKEETFNYSILNDIIKTNKKTYFYADNFKNNSDVAVGVYSLTPYKDYHIIKFQVKNNSTSYFFIGNIEIKIGSKLVICKQYCDNMVAKNRILEGIILAPKFEKNEKVKFKLIESGNKDRNYEITFKIP